MFGVFPNNKLITEILRENTTSNQMHSAYKTTLISTSEDTNDFYIAQICGYTKHMRIDEQSNKPFCKVNEENEVTLH